MACSHRTAVSSTRKALFEDGKGVRAVSSSGKTVFEDEMADSIMVTPEILGMLQMSSYSGDSQVAFHSVSGRDLLL